MCPGLLPESLRGGGTDREIISIFFMNISQSRDYSHGKEEEEEPAELSTGADDDSLSAFDEVGFLDGSQSKEPAAMDH